MKSSCLQPPVSVSAHQAERRTSHQRFCLRHGRNPRNKVGLEQSNGSGSNPRKPLNWLTRAFKTQYPMRLATRLRNRCRPSSALGRIATMARTRPKTVWRKPLPALDKSTLEATTCQRYVSRTAQFDPFIRPLAPAQLHPRRSGARKRRGQRFQRLSR